MTSTNRGLPDMDDANTQVAFLRSLVADFAREREWESLHNLKNLAEGISVEAGELLELFLWKSPEEIERRLDQPEYRLQIEYEIADVLILCLILANHLNIDVSSVISAKLGVDAFKYPANKVRGRPGR